MDLRELKKLKLPNSVESLKEISLISLVERVVSKEISDIVLPVPVAGPRGEKGDSIVGPPGPAGESIVGFAGKNGIDGARGSKWFNGDGPPINLSGVVRGDYYLDDLTGDVYEFL